MRAARPEVTNLRYACSAISVTAPTHRIQVGQVGVERGLRADLASPHPRCATGRRSIPLARPCSSVPIAVPSSATTSASEQRGQRTDGLDSDAAQGGRGDGPDAPQLAHRQRRQQLTFGALGAPLVPRPA